MVFAYSMEFPVPRKMIHRLPGSNRSTFNIFFITNSSKDNRKNTYNCVCSIRDGNSYMSNS